MEDEHAPSEATGLLHQARLAAGLSKRELAARMGVARGTLRAAEDGKDLRHSTLQAYHATLPALSPPVLLLPGEGRVPPASDATWAFQREAQGLSVRRLTKTVRHEADGSRVELELAGVKSLGASLVDLELRESLMRSACQGAPKVVAQVHARPSDLKGRPLIVEDGDETHEFRFARDLQRSGFTYLRNGRCREQPELEEGDWEVTNSRACARLDWHVEVVHPIETLELIVHLPGAVEVESIALAWPMALVDDGDESLVPGRLHDLHGGLSCERRGRRLRLRVKRPLVGACYGIGCRPAAEGADVETRVSREDGGTSPGPALRTAREAEGLSLRGLAARTGLNSMTVRAAEQGSDPFRSTLTACLESLPALSPWALLDDPDRPLVRSEVWEYVRDLYGCEVASETKRVRIVADGGSRIDIVTDGLRRLRNRGADCVVRLGMSPSILRATRASLQAVDMSERSRAPRLRIARVREAGGDSHQLRIPADLAATGVGFTRRLEHAGAFVMTAERARELTGQEGTFKEGTSFAALLPTRRLHVEVRFPPGRWPLEPACHVWPLARIPQPDDRDLTERLHPEGLELTVEPRRRRLHLTVELPLIGFKYALGWTLP
ncbi:MAG: hypothetical protein AAF533_30490 [Acidobacteriota bacterium]